jgi:predicted nucleic acid-binding protein
LITTFLDANVLIAAYKGQPALRSIARKVLNNTNREFVASPFLELEVRPFCEDDEEEEFMRVYFDRVLASRGDLHQIVGIAYEEAKQHRIKAMDALHVAAASLAGATELITAERSDSAIYRTKLIKVLSLADL